MITIEGKAEGYMEKLKELSYKDYDGALIIPPEGEEQLSELLRSTRLGKLSLVTMTTDLDRDVRVFGVQSNGLVAGHMAGELLATLLGPGKKVALVTGQMTSQIHKSTAKGFLDEVEAQKLTFAGTYEHYDDPKKAYETAGRLIAEHPDLDGIYLATANSSPSAADWWSWDTAARSKSSRPTYFRKWWSWSGRDWCTQPFSRILLIREGWQSSTCSSTCWGKENSRKMRFFWIRRL